jgi:E3 ubiquitin-protein ligase TRIP12
LNWVTGSNRLPAGGFGALNPKMTLNRKRENNNFGKPDAGLPTVNTCKHYVKMPEYTSYEQLKERFNLATKEDDHHFDLN